VKNSFNALDSVTIKDDFYANPDEMRQLALTRSYQEPPANTPRLAVTSPCDDQETRAMCELLKPYVPEVKYNAVAAVRVVFRYTLANATKKVYCHVDGCSGAGIVYLTQPDDCAGGTSIFRHKPTGDEIYDKANAHLYDFVDGSQWETISEIEMIYNRLVFYPGQLFHSITPVFFGDSITNARLTQNVFIFRENDNSLM
jgi:hypothetical protein